MNAGLCLPNPAETEVLRANGLDRLDDPRSVAELAARLQEAEDRIEELEDEIDDALMEIAMVLPDGVGNLSLNGAVHELIDLVPDEDGEDEKP